MRIVLRIAIIVIAVFALPAGCLSTPRPEVTIYEGPQGVVYLERVADRNFQAAHPLSLNPIVIARVLNGVHIRDDKTTIQTLLGSTPKGTRAFSDEDTEFLTPLIVKALEKATADQRIGVKLFNRTASGVETTAATLYAHGLSLHLTFVEYRHKPDRPDDVHMPVRRLPDPSGLQHRAIFFAPEAARRPDTYQRTSFFGQLDEATLVIDYGYLAKDALVAASPPSSLQEGRESQPNNTLPHPSLPQAEPVKATESTLAPSEELQSLKDLVIKKDLEVEGLKQEVRSLRRQLAERDALLEGLKRKSKTPSRPQQSDP